MHCIRDRVHAGMCVQPWPGCISRLTLDPPANLVCDRTSPSTLLICGVRLLGRRPSP